MDEKTLRILLTMGVNPQSVQGAVAELEKIHKELTSLEKSAKEIKAEIENALKQGGNTNKLAAELAVVEKAMDRLRERAKGALGSALATETERAAAAAKKYKEQMKEVALVNRQAGQSAFYLRDVGEKLNQVGSMLSRVGTNITTPIFGALNAFLQTANQADPIATRWRSAQLEIERSYMRIGAVATNELLPAIEAAARLMDTVADFVERNPGAISLALGTGITAKIGGAVLQTGGTILTSLGALKSLGLLGGSATGTAAGGGALATIGTALTAISPALLTIASVLGGIGLGAGVYEGMARSKWGQDMGLATLNQYATVGANILGDLFSNISTALGLLDETEAERKTTIFTAMIAKITGAIDENSPLWQSALSMLPSETAGTAQPMISQEALDAYQRYQEQIASLEEQYGEQRSAIVEQYAKQRAQLEAQYEQQRAVYIQRFQQQEADALEDYYASRAEAAQDYQIDVQRAEKDHQRQMRDLLKDHQQRMSDLTDARDALGLVREERAYEDERQQAEEEYQIEMKRRSEDFARQLQQMENQFRIQRERRIRDFNQQLEEMAAQHEQQMALLQQQEVETLQELERGYEEQKQLLAKSLRETVLTIDANLIGGQAELQARSAKLLSDFKQWLESVQLNMPGTGFQSNYYQSGIFGRAIGGYADNGIYRLGEAGREFVLNNRATRAAEQIMHGRLTQDGLVATLGGRQMMHVTVNTGGLSMSQIRQVVENELGVFGKQLAMAIR